MTSALKNSPIVVCGDPGDELYKELKKSVTNKIEQNKLKADELKYIERLNLMPTRDHSGESIDIDPKYIERLKTLCQLWDIDLRVDNISSHRPFIGPVIVAFKKFIFSILRVLLKNTLRQQRDFNAGVINLLSELSKKS